MKMPTTPETGHFCWVDLATHDADRAAAFYGDLFGWKPRDERVGPGHVTRLLSNGTAVGSLYQLNREQIHRGVPSHWTPYVAVASLDATSKRAASLGGRIIVKSFEVPGVARVGLVMDPIGALIGLWQQTNGRDNSG